MNRPEKWTQLPGVLIQAIANEVSFDYCYEGSNAEEIDKILNGYYDDMEWHINFRLMQSKYEGFSDKQLSDLCQYEIESAQKRIEIINNFLKS